ncbi:tRNA (adenosine(37)-N6)-threonylcarbamoyltransferase complex transferase subunit TsaD [Campylobacter sp. MIT 97-5078]|uniref:tRNA (adenosine(37)-N6)-threonylcarbamoyltransferase complex transferase subunit TsaD n=1 Tax=Campylobacter sp. MIT 97-5078 TaxID=1548153 RepID=UPI000512FFBF|nr:tRNA (adenosine(37)-N6)-threonylcarbamoyltransferase complex transferase subunit TsaD [Campylobacter sp. MIT 97-5078]KGI55508.1 protein kinase [Campylobacter sp. MIT 97-5078]TQR27666.1 tRNA (adenosine(37)-N6)-threonylcarbamoyltransferase complex transferase subunit TsaD [Campylobacter sp. MIT 97-5078]
MKNLILAIESSCDDSSLAIINKDDLSCVFEKKISQELQHSQYGGVVPELAARLHTAALPQILEQAKPFLNRLCAIAVTNEPGLSVSLIGGISMAKTLALSLNLPLLAINHLAGHIYSLFLNEKASFDMGVLLVSGGHTMVLFIDKQGKVNELAKTLDDSFGESFDKVAKMMGLGYPGGNAIEKLALKATEKKLFFNIPLKHSKDLNYSFSGLKNAVRLELLKHEKLDENTKSEIAFAFQNAAIAHILDKLEKIFSLHRFKSFGVVGGASANLSLRSRLEALCKKYDCELKLVTLSHCSDNALMIARAACEKFKKQEFTNIKMDILRTRSENLGYI